MKRKAKTKLSLKRLRSKKRLKSQKRVLKSLKQLQERKQRKREVQIQLIYHSCKVWELNPTFKMSTFTRQANGFLYWLVNLNRRLQRLLLRKMTIRKNFKSSRNLCNLKEVSRLFQLQFQDLSRAHRLSSKILSNLWLQLLHLTTAKLLYISLTLQKKNSSLVLSLFIRWVVCINSQSKKWG